MVGDAREMDRETPLDCRTLHVPDCADGSPVATLEVPLQVIAVDIHVVVLLVLCGLHHATRLSCNNNNNSNITSIALKPSGTRLSEMQQCVVVFAARGN